MHTGSELRVETEAQKQDRGRRAAVVQVARRWLVHFDALSNQLKIHADTNRAVEMALAELERDHQALLGSATLYAVLFAPMLHYFFRVADDGATSVAAAGLITAMAFSGLTLVAFVTRKDLSFLRPIVMYGFVAAFVLIVAAALFGLSLGVWFVLGMIVLSGVAILYQTQTIIREFPVAAHVGAALALFSSVMTLFWYVLQLVGIMRD